MRNQFFTFIILLHFSIISFSQNASIIVFDAADKKPIPNVHICTDAKESDEQHYWVSDDKGTLENKVKAVSQIAISFVGYETLIENIEPNKNYTFYLQPKVQSINEVIITGQIKPIQADKSIYNVQLINNQQITNRAATNMANLLASELNVNVQNSGVLGSTITMQGLSGEHIKILVDGVPVIGRQNGNIDLNQLNLQNVDHIEIIEGSMSVIYGSNAVAGAINIITKKNLRPKYAVAANTYFESVGTANTDVLFTKNFNNHHINITAGHNFFNGYKFSDDYRRYDFHPKRQWFGTADYIYKKNKTEFQISQDFFNEQLRYMGNAEYNAIKNIDGLKYLSPTAIDEYHYTLRTNTKAILKQEINEHSNFDILTAFSYYNRSKQSYLKDLYTLNKEEIIDSSAHDTTFFNTIMSRGNYNYWNKKWEIQSGYDINHETGNGKRIIETKSIGEYALYGNLKYEPIPSLSFQGGARIMYNTKYNAPISYSINSKWSPLQEINVRASYGKGFRSPSLKELYLNFVDVNHNVQGNPDLNPEIPVNLNISTDYSVNKDNSSCKYGLKFYHNRINNKIDFLYDSIDNTKAEYINIDGIFKTIGGQADITYKFHPRFTFTTGINYYGNSKIANLDEYTFTPDIMASANYHNLKYLFRINIYYKYFGRQSQFYEVGTDIESAIEQRYIDAYNLLDLTLSRPFFKSKLDVSIGAKNILDVKQISSSGSSGVHSGGGNGSSNIAYGRTFFVKLSFNLTKF